MIDVKHLPIVLPEVENYLPTADGKPPLGNAKEWAWDSEECKVKSVQLIDNKTIFPLELNTMPGWAGSSWYFLRYMDPKNEAEFVSKKQVDYWQNVDLYIGGSEHGTGHLLYSRFWTKFLNDKGFISFDEPFKKMINQGMILGRSSLVCKLVLSPHISSTGERGDRKMFEFIDKITNSMNPIFISESLIQNRQIDYINTKFLDLIENLIPITTKEIRDEVFSAYPSSKVYFYIQNIFKYHVDISLMENDKLDIEAFKNSREEYKNAEFICEENGDFICGHLVEKMSKSLFNVQTPDELVEKFGADTLRMYEMFLGPLEQSKPWDTKGINGVSNFLRKLWRLFNFDENGTAHFSDAEVSKDSYKTLHKTIQKIEDDLNRFSFNTGVSNFMICVNELQEQKCSNKEVLQDLVILLSPYTPHISEELWVKLGHEAGTISFATFPSFNPEYLVSDAFSYPISFNGKVRFNLEFPRTMTPKEIEELVLAHENTAKYLEGKTPKKMIVVPGRIVNVVV
jgi:leucyl-tRNA synthetase